MQSNLGMGRCPFSFFFNFYKEPHDVSKEKAKGAVEFLVLPLIHGALG